MLYHTVLLALASTAVAGGITPGQAVKRDSAECTTSLLDIMKADPMPTPPSELNKFWKSQATATNPCLVTLPASLSSAASSFQAALSSWSADNADALDSFTKECPDMLTAPMPTDCPDVSGSDGDNDDSDDDKNDDKNDGGDDDGESGGDSDGDDDGDGEGEGDTNAATRPTGLLGAAVAAAAFIGAVAVL